MKKNILTLACLFLSGQMMVEANEFENEKTISFKIAVITIGNKDNLDLNDSLQQSLFNLLDANNNENITATYSFDNTDSFDTVLTKIQELETATLIANQSVTIENNSTGTVSTATRNDSDTETAISFGITPSFNNDTNTIDLAFEFNNNKTLLPSNIVPGETFIISNENVILLVCSEIIA